MLERLVAEVRPAAMLVEGPCDFDAHLPLLHDARTKAPVAIVALKEGGGKKDGGTRRVASYFPFCAHSPELVAIQAAARLNIPVRFIDLPSHAREMADGPDDTAGRSLLGDERAFDVGDYVDALVRELGCRDGNEVWDQLFEARLAETDWRRFFADVGQYCACLRAATSDAQMQADGTLPREAQMRALIDRARSEITGPIVVLVGGFHAPALFEPATAKPVPPDPRAGRSYLIRYGMRQLDALAGYGAGLPLPGFYDRLWQDRASGGAGLALAIVTGFAAHLRDGKGDMPSFPTISGAVEQAQRLAMLRARPFPARDDIVDAIRSTFIKDEIPAGEVPLLRSFRDWLTGSAIGEVPPGTGSPPLVEAARASARAMGFSVEDGDRRTRELDIYRKDKHRAASRFCHAMTFIGTPFAQRTAGPDFRNDAMLDRLHEMWSVCWSPMVEARLIELSEAADTLDEALAFVLAQRIAELEDEGRGRSAVAAIDLFAAACRAGLGRHADAVLALVETQVMEDPELGSLAAALTDLVLLRRGRATLGIDNADAIDRLIMTCWRRVLVLLPDMAQCGEDSLRPAITALADLRGAIALAQSSNAPIDRASFDEALALLAQADLPPMLAGAVFAFALVDGQVDATQLNTRLRGELASAYVDPADRLGFLGGIIAIGRELLWTGPAIITALNTVISTLDDAEFTDLLPHLRLALMALDPRETDRLAEEVAAMIGVSAGQITALVDISEAELAENIAMDRALAAALAADGIAA